jgi:hypothetical protein
MAQIPADDACYVRRFTSESLKSHFIPLGHTIGPSYPSISKVQILCVVYHKVASFIKRRFVLKIIF